MPLLLDIFIEPYEPYERLRGVLKCPQTLCPLYVHCMSTVTLIALSLTPVRYRNPYIYSDRPPRFCGTHFARVRSRYLKRKKRFLSKPKLDKSLNKGLISEDRNARLLCPLQYPVLVQVVCMGFISGGNRIWYLQRARGFSPPATRWDSWAEALFVFA